MSTTYLLHFKRCPFRLQKMAFQTLKGHLSQCNMPPFGKPQANCSYDIRLT